MFTLLSLARPVSRSSLERLYRARQSHPNPLHLSLTQSEIYRGNGVCQSHLSYLKCFQHLSPEKGGFFSKKIVTCVQAVPVGRSVEPEEAKKRPEASWDVPCVERDARPISGSVPIWAYGRPLWPPGVCDSSTWAATRAARTCICQLLTLNSRLSAPTLSPFARGLVGGVR